MKTLLLLAALAAAQDSSAPKLALPRRPSATSSGGSAQLVAFDADGRPLDAASLLAYISRADHRGPVPLWARVPEGSTAFRPTLAQQGDLVVLTWPKVPRIVLSMPWPVVDDGFSTLLIDRDGRGIADGDVIRVNEELALTQYRLFKEAWIKHSKDADPQYEPSVKARRLSDQARDSMAEAQGAKKPETRAKLFDRALHDVSAAWQKMLVEHGQEIAGSERRRKSARYGLTLDESLLRRIEHYQWIDEAVQRSGSNWVRVVFSPRPDDFTYSRQASFNEYDAIVKDLRDRGLRVMGGVLDTAQWPNTLTPEIYTERAKNLVLHYKGQINCWEIGSEINGNWLGGSRNPIAAEDVYRIYQSAADALKTLDPGLELVASLYWWEGTAPDDEHTLFGWLARFIPRGFGRNVDVVALSIQPEDNPVGMALERIFEKTHLALPEKRLMVGSYGYVEGEELKGFWWLHPKDVDGARKDLVTLITPGALALDASLGGGFWWQTLDQMLPVKGKSTDLFKVYKRTVSSLVR